MYSTHVTSTILVTGATGNVGAPLVDALARQGVSVRAGSRHPGQADDPLIDPVRLDFTDPSNWDDAFTGVEALFLVRPPTLTKPKRDLFPALARAVELGLRHVVFLSVQGVEKLKVVPHATIETWLRESGLSWTFLRASFFDQNLIAVHGPAVRERNELIMPAGRGRTAFIDTYDIAAVAALALTEPQRHRNRAYTLTGSEALTYGEVAGIMTAVLGRPIRYTQPGLVRYALTAHARVGLPIDLVAMTSVIYTTARLGLAAGLTDDVSTILGRSPISMTEFVDRERAAFAPESQS